MLKTYKITVAGQVQGVGFRPYVYTLATEFNLKGTVSNNQEGVLIYITGTKESIDQFYYKLMHFPPPAANIQKSEIIEIELVLFDDFQIRLFATFRNVDSKYVIRNLTEMNQLLSCHF